MGADCLSYKCKIKNVYNSLRLSEKKAADYILKNGYNVSGMTLAELSKQTEVSEPTIIRFVKAIGYSGFSDFKMNMAKDWGRESVNEVTEKSLLVDVHISKDEEIQDIPKKMIGMTIKSLEDTLKLINFDNYRNAIEAIKKAQSIDIYGVGNSASIASDIMNKFIRIGLKCRAYPDNHVQQICASHLGEKDVAIAVSHSGNTIDTVNTLKIAKECGAKTIALTNYKASLISKYADITLFTGDVETTFYSETMVSRISQLAIVDMLYMGVLLSDYDLYTKRLDKTNILVEKKNY